MAKPLKSRAFDAFMPDTEPGREVDNARHLPLTLIDINPDQARQSFDEAALDELTASVRAHGVLQPIGVRAVGGRYRIIWGERRYRAATEAGLSDIPAVIYEDLDDDQAAVLTALENLQREDLDLEEEAQQFAKLLAAGGLSQRALAERLGKSHNYVSRRLRLLREAPEVFAAIRNGQVTLEAALSAVVEYRPIVSPTTAGSQVYRADTVSPNSESSPAVLINGQPHPTAALTPEDFPATVAEPRVSRLELLDPAKTDQVARAFKPAAHFTNYVARLQPADVAPPDRVPLAERLETAAREASLLARALRQAAGEETR